MIRGTDWTYKLLNPLIGSRGLRGINSKNFFFYSKCYILLWKHYIVINRGTNWTLEWVIPLCYFNRKCPNLWDYYCHDWINSLKLFYFSIWMKRIKVDWLYLLIILTIHCWIWESADWSKPTNTHRRTY